MITAIRNIASVNRIITTAKWNEKKGHHITAVAVAQPPFFKNKIVNYKKTTSFKLI